MSTDNISPSSDNSFHDAAGNCTVAAMRDEVLDRYLLAGMSREESAAFVEHLLFCSACNRALRLREALLEVLREEERLSPPYRERAMEIAKLRPAGGSLSVDRMRFSRSLKWLAAAVVLLAVFLSGFFGIFRSAPSPRQLLARLEQSDYKPYHLQNSSDQRWNEYNRGLDLLFQAQQGHWWQLDYPSDHKRVRLAIGSLEAVYLRGVPADIGMDVCAYLFRAHLLLGEDENALAWLEKSASLAANRSKLQRALELAGGYETLLRQEEGGASAATERLLARCRELQQILRALTAQ